MGESELHICFLEERYCVPPDDSLTFGRIADLSIDDNRYLHRVAGRFLVEDGSWALENTGKFMTLTLRGEGQAVATTVPPGQHVRLIDQRWTVSFKAGQCSYQIEGWFDAPLAVPETELASHGSGDSTQVFGLIELSNGQRRVMVALAEDVLRGRLDPVFPSSKQIADRLGSGITEKAVERRLDTVAQKLHDAGLPGVKGAAGASADQRRQRMARHLIESRVIHVDDLNLLP